MKKILFYILTVFIFTGFLFSTVSVLAQTQPGGVCTDSSGNPPADESFSASKESCIGGGYSWTPTTTQTGTTTTGATTNGASTSATNTSSYQLLAPIPCTQEISPGVANTNCQNGTMNTFDTSGSKLGTYLNTMIRVFIGICAILAVVMIIVGGIEYMTSELMSSKEEGKHRINNAIFGLLLALASYALLYTINPEILKTDLNLPQATINVVTTSSGGVDATVSPPASGRTYNPTSPDVLGKSCDPSRVELSNTASNLGLTDPQVKTLACISWAESSCGAGSMQNIAGWGKGTSTKNPGSSAYGHFQILLNSHANCYEAAACHAAAGVNGSLNCNTAFDSIGNPKTDTASVQILNNCIRAARSIDCSVAAAACLINEDKGFSAWASPDDLACRKQFGQK